MIRKEHDEKLFEFAIWMMGNYGGDGYCEIISLDYRKYANTFDTWRNTYTYLKNWQRMESEHEIMFARDERGQEGIVFSPKLPDNGVHFCEYTIILNAGGLFRASRGNK